MFAGESACSPASSLSLGLDGVRGTLSLPGICSVITGPEKAPSSTVGERGHVFFFVEAVLVARCGCFCSDEGPAPAAEIDLALGAAVAKRKHS